ncbi:phosphodiester glycosidase family protein [Nostoc sp. CHAB 5824]|nr:phosphodiester glycosidase family protein [Nostoc sp. CHAB 5824]
MTWKARLLEKTIALYLVVPGSLFLAVAEPLVSSANQESKHTDKYYSHSLPLGKPHLRESRLSNEIGRGVTHTAVDGRQPGWNVGASFEESAQIMRSLRAKDALNLDGGGSTTITINQQLINRPSDSTGERPIADAIIIQKRIDAPTP